MYDDFSTDYDRFVNWPARLAAELPFIQHLLGQAENSYILDAACGTGRHTIALAQQGYLVIGADASAGMIAQARANAAAAGVDVRFAVARFGQLARLGSGFTALLCLGNSLPHVLTAAALQEALADFAACLRPDGLLLIQNLNYDRILAKHERWLGPQSHREGEQEWLFLRFYDFDPDGLLTFNIVRLYRTAGAWEQQVLSTRLWPQRRAELAAALERAGFREITCYGDMTGTPFDPDQSPNLVIATRRIA